MGATKKELIESFSDIVGFKVPLDGIMSYINSEVTVDTVALDKKFSEHDKDYNCHSGTYKGAKVSMAQYIELKWGKAAIKIFEKI